MIVGEVTSPPKWHRRAVGARGGKEIFEPVIVVAVTLNGGDGWRTPVVVTRLDVTRVDEGTFASLPSLQTPAHAAVLQFLHRNGDAELLNLRMMREKPPTGAALDALPILLDR